MAREKFPDLMELSPKKQLDGLPSMPKNKCGRRNRNCSVHGGGCGYRFKKSDKHWVCPKCGADRRCWSNRVMKKKTCRMHGGRGGRKPPKGYAIYHSLKGFNEIFESPDLLNNRYQIAALESQSQKLVKEAEEHDSLALLDDAAKAAAMIVAGLRYGKQFRIQAGTDMLLEALAPLRNAREINRELRENWRLAGILKDQEMKRGLAEAGMIPAVVVWEFIGLIQRLMFQFLPNQDDRAAYMRELMAHIPEPPGTQNGDTSKTK